MIEHDDEAQSLTISIAPDELASALEIRANGERLVRNEIRRLARRGEPLTAQLVVANIMRRKAPADLTHEELVPIARAALEARVKRQRPRS